VGVNVVVDDLGMRMGATPSTGPGDHLSQQVRPTSVDPDGKKALKLQMGDVIKWRPITPTTELFSLIVVTVAANHLKAMMCRIRRTMQEARALRF